MPSSRTVVQPSHAASWSSQSSRGLGFEAQMPCNPHVCSGLLTELARLERLTLEGRLFLCLSVFSVHLGSLPPRQSTYIGIV